VLLALWHPEMKGDREMQNKATTLIQCISSGTPSFSLQAHPC